MKTTGFALWRQRWFFPPFRAHAIQQAPCTVCCSCAVFLCVFGCLFRSCDVLWNKCSPWGLRPLFCLLMLRLRITGIIYARFTCNALVGVAESFRGRWQIIVMSPGPASDINPKHLMILSHKVNTDNISIRQQLRLIQARHNGLGNIFVRLFAVKFCSFFFG